MQDDKKEEERRIAEVLQIAESLAIGERPVHEVFDGYTRLGAAHHGSFRFKWTAHEAGDGRYIVDETIGSSTVPLRSRPLAKDEVIAFIDERQRLQVQKVEEVRREWAMVQVVAPAVAVEASPEPVAMAVDSKKPVAAVATPRDPLEMYDEIRRLLKEQS